MSRRIQKDFEIFNNFLSEYNLSSYASTPTQIEACKSMHKKLFGILIFSAEFKFQNIHPDSNLFLEEVTSDLLLSLFCVVQGMYKPATLQLRCSIENFLKAFILIDKPKIVEEKSVYTIFDIAKVNSHFSTIYGNTCINSLHNDYATLCRTVHGDPAVMHPTSALALLPQYNKSLQKSLSDLYLRIVENFLGISYMNYPSVIDQMHPENKKDFLDCIAKTTKQRVIKTLYSN